MKDIDPGWVPIVLILAILIYNLGTLFAPPAPKCPEAQKVELVR